MIIVKVGGGISINWDFIIPDLKNLIAKEQVILVHGAGDIRDNIAKRLQHPTKTVVSPSGISSVYTDQEALEIFLMVYPGLVNKQIVAKLQAASISAVGLSGVDGKIWQAKRKPNLLVKEGKKTKLLKDNFTGRVEKINTHLINLLLDNDYLPVIAPPALSYNNEIVNTDNDWAVAVMAKAMNINKVVYLFEAPGLLKDVNDQHSVIKEISAKEIDNYLVYAQGRMKKKILGAKKAIELGVGNIYWGDGRIKNPITSALNGEGTIIS
jgi:[amino group carrier protein]-L-2-aminoadipate 6-kinase